MSLRWTMLSAVICLLCVPTLAEAHPQAIAAVIVPIIFATPLAGLGFAAASALALGIGYAATAAALYGLQSVFAPDTPGAPKPEDGKFNLRQAVPSLPYVLGEVRKGGDYVLLEEGQGTAFHITVLAGHSIKGVKQHWLHDSPVTVDGSGNVTDPTHFVYKADPKCIIKVRNGADAETAYAEVTAAFPTVWTSAHRGDGLASVLMMVKTVPVERYQTVFPNQMPQHTAVIEGNNRIYDPRTATYGYSTNLALLRMWHLTHPVGGKLTLSDMYLPEWAHAADVCDQTVYDRSGAPLSRYHGGFWFRANNDPIEVGRLMDQAAELVVYERPDGKVGVHAGEFVAPTVRLTSDDLIAVSFDTNRRQSTNVLAVKGQYTSKAAGFSTVDAATYGDPYVDGDATERVRTVKNQAVQHHNHIARLQKITYLRANAPRVTFVAHYETAKAARTQRFVRVHRPPRLNEAIVEIIESPKLSLRNLTIEFQGIVVSEDLYEFDAAVDEGIPPTTAAPVPPSGVPPPVGFDVTIATEIVAGGQTAAFGLATWDFVADALVYELEWQLTSGGAPQTLISEAGETSLRSLYLVDGAEYRFRLRTRSAWKTSDYTDYIIRTAVADPTPPSVATSVSASGGSGSVSFSFTAPNSANYFASLLFLNVVNDFGTASLVATEYGAAKDVESVTVTGLSAGTYYGWVVAINASGVRAAAVATGSISVT